MFLNLPIQICHYLHGSGFFYVNLPLKSNKQKKSKKKKDFLLASWRSLTKRAESGSAESGSASQWYGSGPSSVQMSGKHNTDLVRTTVPVPGPPMFIVQDSRHTSRATFWIWNDTTLVPYYFICNNLILARERRWGRRPSWLSRWRLPLYEGWGRSNICCLAAPPSWRSYSSPHRSQMSCKERGGWDRSNICCQGAPPSWRSCSSPHRSQMSCKERGGWDRSNICCQGAPPSWRSYSSPHRSLMSCKERGGWDRSSICCSVKPPSSRSCSSPHRTHMFCKERGGWDRSSICYSVKPPFSQELQQPSPLTNVL